MNKSHNIRKCNLPIAAGRGHFSCEQNFVLIKSRGHIFVPENEIFIYEQGKLIGTNDYFKKSFRISEIQLSFFILSFLRGIPSKTFLGMSKMYLKLMAHFPGSRDL